MPSLPRALVLIVFFSVAVVTLGPEPSTSSHEAVARGLGLGFTGYRGGLDGPVAALLSFLPLGTMATRASLASILLGAVAVDVAYRTSRDLLRGWGAIPSMIETVAAVAALTVALSTPFLAAATSVGGTMAATLAGMVVVRELLSPKPKLPILALCTMLCSLAEPWLALLALPALALTLAERSRSRDGAELVAAASTVFVPTVLLLSVHLRRSSSAWLSVGEPMTQVASFQRELYSVLVLDWGWAMAALSIAGTAIGIATKSTRREVLVLTASLVAAGLAVWRASGTGPSGHSAAAMVFGLSLSCLGALSMASILAVVQASRLPLASTSAWLVLILQATLPLGIAESSVARIRSVSAGRAEVIPDVLQSDVPSSALVIVDEPDLLLRLLAMRAAGTLRPDIALFPSRALTSPMAAAELRREPRLAPLWQEIALTGGASERTLSALATERPTVVEFGPNTSRSAARYLTPVGLLQVFHPEPRGASDRRKALEAFDLSRQRLLEAWGPLSKKDPSGARLWFDPTLMRLTTRLLRARAVAIARAGDRDVLPTALADLRALVPGDPLLPILEKRLLETKGPISTDDLRF